MIKKWSKICVPDPHTFMFVSAEQKIYWYAFFIRKKYEVYKSLYIIRIIKEITYF